MEGMGLLDRSQQQQLREYLSGTGSRMRQGPGFFQTVSDATNMIGAGALPSTYVAALKVLEDRHLGETGWLTWCGTYVPSTVGRWISSGGIAGGSACRHCAVAGCGRGAGRRQPTSPVVEEA